MTFIMITQTIATDENQQWLQIWFRVFFKHLVTKPRKQRQNGA